jgi:hypothetical protein
LFSLPDAAFAEMLGHSVKRDALLQRHCVLNSQQSQIRFASCIQVVLIILRQ